MRSGETYHKIVVQMLETIEKEQSKNIERAAELIAESIAEDKLINVYAGGGHTWIAVLDVFWRAGGLTCINPLMDYGISPFNKAQLYMKFERLEGYGRAVIDYYNPQKGEVIIINHSIGVNAATIDAAMACKERGLKIIAISSSNWQEKVPKGHVIRHQSGKNLFDFADVCIDHKNPFGDAVIEIEGADTPIGPVSSMIDCYVMQRLVIDTVEKLVEKGVKPPLWRSGNVPGGDEFNKKNVEKYINRVKYL